MAILWLCVVLVIISEWQQLTREAGGEKPGPEKNVFKSKEWLREWRKVRYKALVRDKGMCQCCGRTAQDGVRIEVDHCKAKSKYPALSLELTNLAVLCHECNRSKSNTDHTNWRLINGTSR